MNITQTPRSSETPARAHPSPVVQPEVGQVATAAMMELRRGKPAVSHDQLPTGRRALVGQRQPDPADPGLVDAAPKRPPTHPPPHRGDVEVLDHDSAVAARQVSRQRMDRLAAEVGRPPVQARTLGFRVTVPARPDDPARQLPSNPALLRGKFGPWCGVGNALDRTVAVGDDRPLLPNAKVDTAAPVPWRPAAQAAGCSPWTAAARPPAG